MGKYKIYHIPGVKIGTSVTPQYRVGRQGYDKYEILEEHDCIDKVSDREIELQKEYGYSVDKVDYKTFMKNRNTKGTYTDANRKGLSEKYWGTDKHRDTASKVGKVTHVYLRDTKICDVCGIEVDLGNYAKHHGDNCKDHIYNNIITQYNMGNGSLRKLCKDMGVSRNVVRKRMNNAIKRIQAV